MIDEYNVVAAPEGTIDWPTRLHYALSTGELLDLGNFSSLRPDQRLSRAEDGAAPLPKLDAKVLRNALLAFREVEAPDPNGLSILGVSIRGDLDLDFTELKYPVRLYGVRFEDSLLMKSFRGTDFSIYDSYVGGNVELNHAHIENTLVLSNCQVEGYISAVSLSCGELDFSSTVIINDGATDGENALFADVLAVQGKARCDGLVTRGPISIVGGTIGGYFSLRDSVINVQCEGNPSNPCRKYAIQLDGIRVNGVLHFNDLRTSCSLLARGAQVAGELQLQGAMVGRQKLGRSIPCETTTCLIDLAGIELGNSARLDGVSTGICDMSSATLKHLHLSGARINENADNVSFYASDSTMSSIVINGGDFRGLIDLRNSHVTGDITIATDSAGYKTAIGAVNLSDAKVDRSVRIVGATLSRGGILADRASVQGSFSIDGAAEIGLVHRTRPDKLEPSSLDAPGARFEHLRISAGSVLAGGLDLTGSTVNHLQLGEFSPTLPSIRSTENVTFTRVSGAPFRDWESASKWLTSTTEETPPTSLPTAPFHIQP